MDELIAALEKEVVAAVDPAGRQAKDEREPLLVTRERHAEALTHAADALERFLSLSPPRRGPDWPSLLECSAQELREAAAAVGAVAGDGRIGTEEVLDRLFEEFCIGK